MEALRKIGLWLSGLLIGPALLVAIIAFSIDRTAGNPEYIKQTANESGVYEALGDYISKELVHEGSKEESDAIKKILSSTATPARLQSTIEGSIDSLYQVLNRQVSPAEFTIDMSDLTGALEANANKFIKQHLDSLPACTTAVAPSTDVFDLTCLPAGTNTSALADKAVVELLKDSDLLGGDNITLSDLAKSQDSDALGMQENLQNMVDAYQNAKLILPISVVLAVLSTAGILLLSRPYIRGASRLGVVLLVNGVLTVLVSLLVRALANNFPKASGEMLTVMNSVEQIAKQTVVDIASMVLKFAIAEVVIGLILTIVASIIIAKKLPKTPLDKPKTEANPPAEKPADLETSKK